MRWCTVLISVCVFLTGCIATVEDTSSLGARISKLENRVSGMEHGVPGDSGALQQRVDTVVRDQKYLQTSLDELNQSVARMEEQTGELKIEVGRLQERFNQLETGSIRREESMAKRTESVTALEERYGAQLAQLREDVDKAMQDALEANSRSQKTLAELTDRILQLGNKVDKWTYEDTPPPPPAGSSKIHTVKTGETASAIAAKYGITLQKLRATNPHIPDLNVIRPGDELLIP